MSYETERKKRAETFLSPVYFMVFKISMKNILQGKKSIFACNSKTNDFYSYFNLEKPCITAEDTYHVE